jgi:hypothetical protein
MVGAFTALAALTLTACNEESRHDDVDTVEIEFSKTKTVTPPTPVATLTRYAPIPRTVATRTTR